MLGMDFSLQRARRSVYAVEEVSSGSEKPRQLSRAGMKSIVWGEEKPMSGTGGPL